MDRKTNGSNSIIISEEVIGKVASMAAKDVAGVADVVAKPVNIKGLFKDKLAKAVVIEMFGKAAVIDIYVKLIEGFRLQNVADGIQKAVKEQVQNMTGIVVTKVNVHVCEIELKNEDETVEEA